MTLQDHPSASLTIVITRETLSAPWMIIQVEPPKNAGGGKKLDQMRWIYRYIPCLNPCDWWMSVAAAWAVGFTHGLTASKFAVSQAVPLPMVFQSLKTDETYWKPQTGLLVVWLGSLSCAKPVNLSRINHPQNDQNGWYTPSPNGRLMGPPWGSKPPCSRCSSRDPENRRPTWAMPGPSFSKKPSLNSRLPIPVSGLWRSTGDVNIGEMCTLWKCPRPIAILEITIEPTMSPALEDLPQQVLVVLST